MKVLVYGAGVIGQIYAGRIAAAGHEVTVLARGRTLADLRTRGIVLRRDDTTIEARPRLVETVPDEAFDIALVCIRGDQLDGVLPAVAQVQASRVVVMSNHPRDLVAVIDAIGADRAVLAFPGVGGLVEPDGPIRYIQIGAQKTTVGKHDGLEESVVELFRSADFPVAVVDDMDSWLKTHAVFVAVVGAAILRHGGDAQALAGDYGAVREMVTAVGEGFRALSRQHVSVGPAALRIIFTVVPHLFAVPYWQCQLRGQIGVISIAPHVRATEATEFPRLRDDVLALIRDHGATPELVRLLAHH